MSDADENPLLPHACWGPESAVMSCSFSTVMSGGNPQSPLSALNGSRMDGMEDAQARDMMGLIR